jgi:hypothetical protein
MELCGREMAGKFSLKMPDFHVGFRWSFTCRKRTTWDPRLYFPSEGRRAEDSFRPEKIRRLRSGLNPRTWILKASTLPLDHRSRSAGTCANNTLLYVRYASLQQMRSAPSPILIYSSRVMSPILFTKFLRIGPLCQFSYGTVISVSCGSLVTIASCWKASELLPSQTLRNVCMKNRKFFKSSAIITFWKILFHEINMYINQQDTQISMIKLYFLIRFSTCFGLC